MYPPTVSHTALQKRLAKSHGPDSVLRGPWTSADTDKDAAAARKIKRLRRRRRREGSGNIVNDSSLKRFSSIEYRYAPRDQRTVGKKLLFDAMGVSDVSLFSSVICIYNLVQY